MAARKIAHAHSNKPHSNQARSVKGSTRRAKAATRSLPSAVEDAIEVERERLMRAHTLLSCAAIAMDAEDLAFEGPHYLTIIEMSRDLVSQAINNLEPMVLECSTPTHRAGVDEFGSGELAHGLAHELGHEQDRELNGPARGSRSVREMAEPYRLH
jgi:hypothetical protein